MKLVSRYIDPAKKPFFNYLKKYVNTSNVIIIIHSYNKSIMINLCNSMVPLRSP